MILVLQILTKYYNIYEILSEVNNYKIDRLHGSILMKKKFINT